MLYTNPELLRLLLVPVLNFANNGTSTPFTNPFSPHQIGAENDLENGVPSPASLLCLSRACLGKSSHFHFFETLKQRGGVLSGTYPIADATTASQEPMPMENTGAQNATCTLKRTFYQDRLGTNIGKVEEQSGVFRRQYVSHARRDCPADARCEKHAFLVPFCLTKPRRLTKTGSGQNAESFWKQRCVFSAGESREWLKPFMPMLTTWADYLIASLPFPANQLCTDDFTGRLANNTNLAAKVRETPPFFKAI